MQKKLELDVIVDIQQERSTKLRWWLGTRIIRFGAKLMRTTVNVELKEAKK